MSEQEKSSPQLQVSLFDSLSYINGQWHVSIVDVMKFEEETRASRTGIASLCVQDFLLYLMSHLHSVAVHKLRLPNDERTNL